MNIKQELDCRFSAAMATAGAPEGAPVVVRQSQNPGFGDYQINGIWDRDS